MGETQLVRCVLTAETLIDDYVRAAREMSRRIRSNDEEGFRVHLAEANRLYPAIWEQLDQARAAAAAAGIPTAAYDELKGLHDPNAPGLDYDASEWQIDVLRSIASIGIATRKRISVELNLRGIALGKRAADTFRAAAPDLDWAGEQRALDALGGINVTGSATATAIKVVVGLVLVGIVLVYVYIFSR